MGSFNIASNWITTYLFRARLNVLPRVWVPTALRLERSGVQILIGTRNFSPERPDRLWGQPSLIFSVYRGSSTWIKRSGSEVYHSHLVPRLRIGVAIPLLSLYIFLVRTGKTFYLYVTALHHFLPVFEADAFQDISSTQKLSMHAISFPSQRLCPAYRTLQISIS
jgi:hypothetical protein